MTAPTHRATTTGLILIRIENVPSGHRDTQRTQRVQNSNGARMGRKHVGKTAVRLRRFVAPAAADETFLSGKRWRRTFADDPIFLSVMFFPPREIVMIVHFFENLRA